jgi:hypothetical protein
MILFLLGACKSFYAVATNSQHVAADNFSNFIIFVSALHKANGEKRPVGPGDRKAGLRLWAQSGMMNLRFAVWG